MTKKHFIALADTIREHNETVRTRLTWDKHNKCGLSTSDLFTDAQIGALAQFCKHQNAQFNTNRWMSYIAGECGPNGGRK